MGARQPRLYGTQSLDEINRRIHRPSSDEAAYQAHPEPIPYESPRYRRWADTDGDGLIAGQSELLPLYFAVIAQNAAMTLASLAVLVAYWIAKRSRLVVVRSRPEGDLP